MKTVRNWKMYVIRCMLVLAAVFAVGLADAGHLPWGTLLSSAQEEDGWHGDEDSGFYYVRDGERLTGMQKIDGAVYYFNNSGYRQSGAIRIKDKLYYFVPLSGRLAVGQSGLRYADSSKTTLYYFYSSKNGTIAYSKWITYKDKKYHVGSDGRLEFGTILVKNRLYHIAGINVGLLRNYARSVYDGKYYYAGSNGVLKTGLRKINGKSYYFDPKDGARIDKEEVMIGQYYYYFGKSGAAARDGWIKRNGKYYYYDKDGHKVFGAVQYDGKTYWCDKNDNGARAVSKWINTGKNIYFFNKKGTINTGFFFVKGKRYYTDNYGRRFRTGWWTYAGRKYYLTKTSYVKTGWFKDGSKTYYFDSSSAAKTGGYYGAAVTGWKNIGSDRYYFRADGTLYKGGWVYDESTGQMCYLGDSTGKVMQRKYASGSYSIKVNRALNTVTVYQGDVPVKAMLCSTGRSIGMTPSGSFQLLDKLRWHTLIGPVYGQYCSHITSSILFHSVPYTTYGNNHTLEYWEYNKLGTAASAGCIRLCTRDAKWLYENCPIGTSVTVYDDYNSAGPLGKPSTSSIGIPCYTNYDPTDENA